MTVVAGGTKLRRHWLPIIPDIRRTKRRLVARRGAHVETPWGVKLRKMGRKEGGVSEHHRLEREGVSFAGQLLIDVQPYLYSIYAKDDEKKGDHRE